MNFDIDFFNQCFDDLQARNYSKYIFRSILSRIIRDVMSAITVANSGNLLDVTKVFGDKQYHNVKPEVVHMIISDVVKTYNGEELEKEIDNGGSANQIENG